MLYAGEEPPPIQFSVLQAAAVSVSHVWTGENHLLRELQVLKCAAACDTLNLRHFYRKVNVDFNAFHLFAQSICGVLQDISRLGGAA